MATRKLEFVAMLNHEAAERQRQVSQQLNSQIHDGAKQVHVCSHACTDARAHSLPNIMAACGVLSCRTEEKPVDSSLQRFHSRSLQVDDLMRAVERLVVLKSEAKTAVAHAQVRFWDHRTLSSGLHGRAIR